MPNRPITLEGANQIFEGEFVIDRHPELGHYRTTYKNREIANRTLRDLCKELVAILKNEVPQP